MNCGLRQAVLKEGFLKSREGRNRRARLGVIRVRRQRELLVAPATGG